MIAVCRELQKSQNTSPEQARVEAGFRGQAGERGVAEAGRQQVGGEHDARDDVPAQPGALVVAQPAQAGRLPESMPSPYARPCFTPKASRRFSSRLIPSRSASVTAASDPPRGNRLKVSPTSGLNSFGPQHDPGGLLDLHAGDALLFRCDVLREELHLFPQLPHRLHPLGAGGALQRRRHVQGQGEADLHPLAAPDGSISGTVWNAARCSRAQLAHSASVLVISTSSKGLAPEAYLRCCHLRPSPGS